MMMMLLTLIVVGVTAYIWSARGFFSALVHMVCVLVAGAVAFGVWEPLGYALLNAAPDRDFGSFLGGMAWALALALPFAVTLALLRWGIDKLLPANAQCETSVDYIGGGVCGLVSGVISAGILVLSIGYLRVGPDYGGYRPVGYTTGIGRGGLEASSEKFVPWVDRIAAGLYSRLSLTTLRTGEPLAKWHPDLVTEPGALRTNYDGRSRNTYKPDAFNLLGIYTVGDPARPEKMDAFLTDTWDDTTQKVTDLHGEAFTTGYLAGYIVKFNSRAKEKVGPVVVGAAQIRLVVKSQQDDDDTKAIHPIAAITNVEDPTKVEFARFRYNSDELYFSSVGGASEATMAFEFPIPAGYQPIALYVKGVRVNLEETTMQPVNYESPMSRDEIVRAGQMVGMGGVGPIIDPNTGQPVQAASGQPINAQPAIASNALGFMIQKGTERDLTVSQETRGWAVRDGEVTLKAEQTKGANAGIDQRLQINRFGTDETTVILKVDVSPSHRTPEWGRELDLADKNAAPTVVDTNGTRYEAVGYVYKDPAITKMRFTRGQPLKGLSEAPSISRNTPDRQLTLVFVVSLGVNIKEFRIGDKVLDDWSEKPIKCDQRQK